GQRGRLAEGEDRQVVGRRVLAQGRGVAGVVAAAALLVVGGEARGRLRQAQAAGAVARQAVSGVGRGAGQAGVDARQVARYVLRADRAQEQQAREEQAERGQRQAR